MAGNKPPAQAPPSPTAISSVRQMLRDHNIDLQGYIGSGSYSKVRIGYSGDMKSKIAIKVIDTSSDSPYVKKFLPRELEIVRVLNHDNIVRVFKILEVHKMVCIVEEYGERGDLLKRIKEKKMLEEHVAKPLFRQLVEALIYLKSRSIVHRDVKCENIFLDHYDNVKLGDFGFSRFLRNSESSSTFCGSRAYVAPEILSGVSYDGCTVDIWSSGIVLYIMVTGLMPYDDRKPKIMLERMMAHRIKFPTYITLTRDVKMLIYEILHPMPTSRLTYDKMCIFPWLAQTPYKMKDGTETD